MSSDTMRDIMRKYWDSRGADTSLMADDVNFTMMANGDEAEGPEAVQELLYNFYNVGFDAHPEITNQIVTDGKAVLEGYVVGKHIGEFAGVPATGKEFRVPLCVVYDVEDEQIKRARIYFEMPVLWEQLGVS